MEAESFTLGKSSSIDAESTATGIDAEDAAMDDLLTCLGIEEAKAQL